MACAIAVGRQFAARVTVLEVIDYTVLSMSGLSAEVPDLAPELRSQVLADLGDLAAPCTDAGIATHVIATCARARHADLIVLGVSGHGALDRALLGSTTHSVVRQSLCPVLTAR